MNELIISIVNNDFTFVIAVFIMIVFRQVFKCFIDIIINDSVIKELPLISILYVVMGILSAVIFVLLTIKAGIIIYELT